MALRGLARTLAGGRLSRGMARLNARHPWSHNDHFHSWILTELPERRRTAVDVGCGHGELLAALAPHFDMMRGTDVDPGMRQLATTRCAGLTHVSVVDQSLSELSADVGGEVDLITMIAVLHHLDVRQALIDVRRLLAHGGRFLVVGMAPPRSARDHAWNLASIVTNPVIGYVKHPWPNRTGPQPPPFPVRDPTMPFDELRAIVEDVMPGASMRHHLGFRHTISWTR